MTRKEFQTKCRHNGVCSSVNIEEALIELLKNQPYNLILIPVTEYAEKGQTSDEALQDALIEYLEGKESVEVSFTDDNDHECYIAGMSLINDMVSVRVYDYYHGQFYDVELCRILDAKDAMRFVLEFGSFDDDKKKLSPAELSDKQLDLLDEFVAAARRLNEAGVSLFWNDDDNALAVANRDAMRGCDFFDQDDEEIASNPKVESVYYSLAASLEVEINYISREQDYLFFPKKG